MEWQTLDQMLSHSIATHPDKPMFGTKQPAVSDDTGGSFQWLSYSEFGEQVDRLTAWLQQAGGKPGDRVLLISRNRVEWAVTAHAAWRLQMMTVPCYEQQSPEDWEFIAGNSGASFLMASTPDVRDTVRASPAVADQMKEVLCFDDGSFQSALDVGAGVLESDPSAARGPVATSPSDLCKLIYTSGTTGAPKGVMLSHANLVSNVQAVRKLAGPRVDSETVTLSFLPFAHVFGATMELHVVTSAGGAIGFAESPKTILDDAKTVRPTAIFAVPTVFSTIYDRVHAKVAESSPIKKAVFDWALSVAKARRKYFDEGRTGPDPVLWVRWQLVKALVFQDIVNLLGGRVRVAFTGGAALSPVIQQFFDDVGIPVLEGYGLTETSPTIACERYGPTEATQGGLRAIDGVDIRICAPEDASGATLPAGEDGEICVVGPNVAAGYWELPDKTAEAFVTLPSGETMFRTGDKGRLSHKGVLAITGRISEQFKLSNGKFVLPGAVEDKIRLLSGQVIRQCFVAGLNKPHTVLLVYPDFELVASQLELTGEDATPARMAGNDRVVALLEREVRDAVQEAGIAAYSAPKAVHVLTEEFTVENGLLTPKLSMRRPIIAERYADAIEGLYRR